MPTSILIGFEYKNNIFPGTLIGFEYKKDIYSSLKYNINYFILIINEYI